jgi:hypothetical protein
MERYASLAVGGMKVCKVKEGESNFLLRVRYRRIDYGLENLLQKTRAVGTSSFNICNR